MKASFELYKCAKDKADKDICDHISNLEKNIPVMERTRLAYIALGATVTGAMEAFIGLVISGTAPEKIGLMVGVAAVALFIGDKGNQKRQDDICIAEKTLDEAGVYKKEIRTSNSDLVEFPDKLQSYLISRLGDETEPKSYFSNKANNIKRAVVAAFGAATIVLYGLKSANDDASKHDDKSICLVITPAYPRELNYCPIPSALACGK